MPSNLGSRLAALEELHRRGQNLGSGMFVRTRTVEDPLERAEIWTAAIQRLTTIESLIFESLLELRHDYPTVSGATLHGLMTPLQHTFESEFYKLCRSVIRERAGELEEDTARAEEIRKRAIEEFELEPPIWLQEIRGG